MHLDDLQTPALLVRLDRVRHNLATVKGQLGGALERWRPHVKTAKIPAVLDLLLQAGLAQLKCATTREADVLLGRARDPIDVLVAYPHRGANLQRCAELAEHHREHRLSVLTEDPEHAAAVRAASPRLGLFVDLDPGWHRSGVPIEERARVRATVTAAGDALRGLHFYDGQLHGGTPDERRRDSHALYDALCALADELSLDDPELITSGTPTYLQALEHGGLAARRHRVSPGTVVYSDVRTEQLGVSGLQRAVHVLTRVVSAPVRGHVTCDAGSKAIDAAVGDPCTVVEGWPALCAMRPSEEHLPLVAGDGRTPLPGTLLELAPMHVCPTVNLADEAVLLESDEIVGVVAVSARGHETRGPKRAT